MALGLAVAGLALAAIGAFVPWVSTDLPALDGEEVPGRALERALGLPLPALRAVAVVGLLAVVAVALLRRGRSRTAAAALAVATGLGAFVLRSRAVDGVAVSRPWAAVELAPGPVVVEVGALLAVVAGLAALLVGAMRRVAPSAAAAAVAVVVGLAGGFLVPVDGPPGPSTRAPFEVVLGEEGGDLLWGAPATQIGAGRLASRERQGTQVGVDLDGGPGLWVLASSRSQPRTWILGELVDGRLLPRTHLAAASSTPPQLIGVADGGVLLLLQGRRNATGIVRVDLDQDDAALPASFGAGAYVPDGTTVLLGLGTSADDEREVRSATGQADGAVAVVVRDRDGATVHRIAPDVVRAGSAWKLGTGGDAGRGYQPVATDADGAVFRVDGDRDERVVDGRGSPVLGGAGDPDCTVSSDALAIHLENATALAVDRAGNRWYGQALPAGEGGSALVVQTAAGEVRELGVDLRSVGSITAAPDGALWVVQLVDARGDGLRVSRILRLADAAATVERLRPAPGRPSACTPPEVVDVATTGATVLPMGADLPADGVPLDRTGRVIVAEDVPGTDGGRNRLIIRLPTRPDRPVAERRSRGLVVADGRGGAWWADGTVDGEGRSRPSLGHVDAEGKVATVDLPGELLPQAFRADPADGALFFSLGIEEVPYRVPIGGSPEVVQEAEDLGRGTTVFGGEEGARFALLDDRELVRLAPGRDPEPWLGRASGGDLTLDLAIQKDAPLGRYPAGSAFLGPDGLPWLLADGYLARVRGPGRVEALAGPKDGLPADADHPLVVDGDVYVVSDGRLHVVAVRG